MLQQIIGVFEQQQFLRYSEAFNFFLAKPVNMILGERCVDFVVRFKDLEFMNDESEYLKRYYAHQEVHPRIVKLTEFYEESIPHPMSNLIPTQCYPVLQKRERKLIKLMIKRQKEHDGGSHHNQWEAHHVSNVLLSGVDRSLESWQEDDSLKLQKSYDSSIHDIYQERESDQETVPVEFRKELIDYSQMKRSSLIMDFKGRVAENLLIAPSQRTVLETEPIAPHPYLGEPEQPQPRSTMTRRQEHYSVKRTSQQHPPGSSSSLDRQNTIRVHQAQNSQHTSQARPKSTKKSFMQYYYSVSPRKTNILNNLYKL